MSIKVAEALKKTVVMLSGDEDAGRAQGLASLLEALEMSKDDFDLETMDADGSLPTQWIGSASTIPFLAARRVVVVRHLLRFDPADAKDADFKSVPPSGLLILVADSEIAASDREQTTGRNRTKWEALVTGAKGHVEKFVSDPKQTVAQVREAIQKRGHKITEKALETLVEMTGGSYSRAMDEAEKLMLFVGEGEQIREADVRDLVVASREWSVFRLLDSIQNGAVPEALRQLRILVGNHPKTEGAAIGQVLPMVSRHFRLLWQARICIDHQVTPESAPSAVRELFPARPNLMSEAPFRQKALLAAARRVSPAQIQRCFAEVAATDARLKGQGASHSAIDTLDRMVLQLVKALGH